MKGKMDATMRLMDEIDSLREAARTQGHAEDVELLARVREVYASQGLEADEAMFTQAFENLYGRKPGEQALVLMGPSDAAPDFNASPSSTPEVSIPVYGPGASIAVGVFLLLAIMGVALLAVLPQGAIMGQVTGPSFAARALAYWSQFSSETRAAMRVFRALGIALAIPVGGFIAWKLAQVIRSRSLKPEAHSDHFYKPTLVIATACAAYVETIQKVLGHSYKIHVAHDEASARVACATLPGIALVLVDACFAAVLDEPGSHGVKAVVLVGALDEMSLDAALNLPGVVDTLSKPLDEPEIKAVVWEHVGRAQLCDRLAPALAGIF